MKISIGADHRGFALKEAVKKHFPKIEWVDVGTYSSERTDYPMYAQKITHNILDGVTTLGILICGSGVGVAMAANRVKKVYAAVCWNSEVARCAKEDDGINVLALPSDFIDAQNACEIVQAWLNAEFKGGRYQERLDMVDAE